MLEVNKNHRVHFRKKAYFYLENFSKNYNNITNTFIIN